MSEGYIRAIEKIASIPWKRVWKYIASVAFALLQLIASTVRCNKFRSPRIAWISSYSLHLRHYTDWFPSSENVSENCIRYRMDCLPSSESVSESCIRAIARIAFNPLKARLKGRCFCCIALLQRLFPTVRCNRFHSAQLREYRAILRKHVVMYVVGNLHASVGPVVFSRALILMVVSAGHWTIYFSVLLTFLSVYSSLSTHNGTEPHSCLFGGSFITIDPYGCLQSL
jgi:hypothetical protein